MDHKWHRHFLDRCVLFSSMSKDPNTKVGAIVVGPDRESRCDGFNGFPRGIEDTPERLSDRDTKLKMVVHAEMNAICNAARIGASLKGCTMYLTATDKSGAVWGGAPCTACTIHVIQTGIIRIVSYPFKAAPSRWSADVGFARSFLDEAGVEMIEIQP